MKFLITGSSSMLAQEVSKAISSKGFDVTLIGRKSDPAFTLENPEDSLKYFVDEIDCVIHFAHSFESYQSSDINVTGAQKIVKTCEGTQVKRIIYISSDSASRISKSHYGQSKYKTERVFLESDISLVLRIGVVLDDSIPSPFLRVKRFVVRRRILFFPSADRPIFRTTTVVEIANSVVDACKSGKVGGPYTPTENIRLMSILEVLNLTDTKPLHVLSIPIGVVYPLASIGREMRIFKRQFDSLISLTTPPDDCKIIPR